MGILDKFLGKKDKNIEPVGKVPTDAEQWEGIGVDVDGLALEAYHRSRQLCGKTIQVGNEPPWIYICSRVKNHEEQYHRGITANLLCEWLNDESDITIVHKDESSGDSNEGRR